MTRRINNNRVNNNINESVKLSRRINAARGMLPCDLVIKDVDYLDVFSCEWRHGDVGIIDGMIASISDPDQSATRRLSGKGKWLVPGFIDAHVHIESSLVDPWGFQNLVLPRGTTTAICDPHELANVLGVGGIKYFLDASEVLLLDLFVMLSSCVPATHLETNGGGNISAAELAALLNHPNALGLAEMMNVPGVLGSDPKCLDKLLAFSGFPIDGHCPLLGGKDLSAYRAAGISSCHESSRLDEAREKLSKGISIWIREGSVAKDLKALIPLLNLATSTSIGFCTDDRNPLDIVSEGHIDHIIRQAIALGAPARVAYRSASWTVARHYGLKNKGAIAPGYQADLVLLDDYQTCAISDVIKAGRLVSEMVELKSPSPMPLFGQDTIRAKIPDSTALIGPSGRVHVIGVKRGKIITEHLVLAHDSSGVARLSVLERHGRNSKPANGYVHGFGEKFSGALASSVGHDSHNLIVVGDNEIDMRLAITTISESGGGFCVVCDGAVLAELPLPFGGLMSREEPMQVEKKLRLLHKASRRIGCSLDEPFLQLAFLSLPVIPSLKLTDKGLVDVDKFSLIDVRAT